MKPFDLASLQAKHLPRLDWRTLLSPREGTVISEDDQTAYEKYFRQFVDAKMCVGCGSQLGCKGTGEAMDILDGLMHATFVWGIAHGEGGCSKCGYPARALHYDIGGIKSLQLILQYHPDELTVATKKDYNYGNEN